MTRYHVNPKTGKAARCRAKEACPFGGTIGTETSRDGTVRTGSLDRAEKRAEELTTSTYEQEEMKRQSEALKLGGWSHRGNLEGDSNEEFARKAAVAREQREQLHEEKKKAVIAEKLQRKEEEQLQAAKDLKASRQAEIDRVLKKKKRNGKRKHDESSNAKKKAFEKKLSRKEKREKLKAKEKARWAKLSRTEKAKEILGWKESKKTGTKPDSKSSFINSIDSWVEEQERRGKTSEEAIDALLSGKSF